MPVTDIVELLQESSVATPIAGDSAGASSMASPSTRASAAQPIYRISPCYADIREHPWRLSQPARGPNPCRSLISNGIYRSGTGSAPNWPFTGVLAPVSRGSRKRVAPGTRTARSARDPDFPLNPMAGGDPAHHRRSPPMRRTTAHASLDKPAHLRLCQAQQEVRAWSNDCD